MKLEYCTVEINDGSTITSIHDVKNISIVKDNNKEIQKIYFELDDPKHQWDFNIQGNILTLDFNNFANILYIKIDNELIYQKKFKI